MSERRFFTESDFNAFDETYATSEDSKIIAARKFVVEHRMRDLHNDNGSGKGLDNFFKKRDLYPHWQKQHLTNVYWPFPIANGGWVDYLRMGYGKEKSLVKDLADRTGVFTEISDVGTREAIAFYCVTQLQIGIDYHGWWINLYIDKKGWIEQNNLLQKIYSCNKNKTKFINLLEIINKESYEFILYTKNEDVNYDENNPDEFINIMKKLKSNKESYSVSIQKLHNRYDRQNNCDMLNYLKGEFIKLLPLYNFISWHPKSNNYLGI